MRGGHIFPTTKISNVAVEDQAVAKKREMVPEQCSCPVVSDEIRSHVANFPAVESSIQELSRGLVYIREYAQAMPPDSQVRNLGDLSEKALGLLAAVRSDLRHFVGHQPASDIPEDPELLKELLQEKRPHAEVDNKLASATFQTLPLCVKVATSLEYVIQVYKMDLDSFAPATGETWHQNIERASNRRIATAEATIEALQEIMRN